MSPVVIVLVSDGKRCLLGRQPSFPRGMYSALAGFCDMGQCRLTCKSTGCVPQIQVHTPVEPTRLLSVCFRGVSGGDSEQGGGGGGGSGGLQCLLQLLAALAFSPQLLHAELPCLR